MNSSSHSVNGDIAIQWEWSNFDPSQNPNLFTDYDKLCTIDCVHESNTLPKMCANRPKGSVWANTRNIRPYLFFILIYFFPDSPTEAIRRRIFTHKCSNYAQSRKEVPFWGPHDSRPHLRGQIPQKPSKLVIYKHVRASAN